MDAIDFAKSILYGHSLEEKLQSFDGKVLFKSKPEAIPESPSRTKTLQFSEKNIKFPKKGTLNLIENKAKALHFFANHELLAIEMMAAAVIRYPHHTLELRKFKLGMLKNLEDEQKHLKLYRSRMNELGYDFGDFPVNDFFWKQMSKLETPSQFLSLMALTFEAANLDFALYYSSLFEGIEDYKTKDILDIVLADEISHVAFGVHFMHLWRGRKDLWCYYLENLPWPVSPSRSKGIHFNKSLREKAKFSEDFILKLENYDDGFAVTQRKEWKN